MYLIQILLPLTDQMHMPFPLLHYQQVRAALTKKFHGLTVYMRAPAEGLWKDESHTVVKDDIVIFEVMSDALNEAWWYDYKKSLMRLFSQDEVIIRAQEMRLL